jgi:hypothetical protein
LGVVSDSGAVAFTIHNRTADDYGYLRFQNNAGTETQAYIGCERTGTSAGNLLFETSGSERMRIDSSGRLLVGATSASGSYLIQSFGNSGSSTGSGGIVIGRNTSSVGSSSTLGSVYFSNTNSDTLSAVTCFSDGTQTTNSSTPGAITLATTGTGATSPTERMRIDSSGRLLVGTSSTRAMYGSVNNQFQIEGSSHATSSMSLTRTGGAAPQINLASSANSSFGLVSNGGDLGFIAFMGADGSAMRSAAYIGAEVDGTPGTNDMPGRLIFATTADGASSPTERMRIGSDGSVIFNSDTTDFGTGSGRRAGFNQPSGYFMVQTYQSDLLRLNRNGNDGILVRFYQANTEEGNISVSGTTVSYNGAHLSRWSQLPGGATREEILRGTVLSNLDEMCEWGEEDNEQLNRMQVSDVEGDRNVSGVFQAWDDEDDTYTNDFYCAMTGDFVIRIAQGTTVARGDLLMSAGDGTAKPQDDDIIRSKTIAKVTSTHVSETYADGSYCVPCVLMAC